MASIWKILLGLNQLNWGDCLELFHRSALRREEGISEKKTMSGLNSEWGDIFVASIHISSTAAGLLFHRGGDQINENKTMHCNEWDTLRGTHLRRTHRVEHSFVASIHRSPTAAGHKRDAAAKSVQSADRPQIRPHFVTILNKYQEPSRHFPWCGDKYKCHDVGGDNMY